MKKRLDQVLVDLGLAPSKTKAQEMIELGQVTVKDRSSGTLTMAQKSAQKVDPLLSEILLKEHNLLKFVARSGFKLEAALEKLKNRVDVVGLSALDVGQSTGGFTDCLLQRGAKHVTGVDVATGELADRFRLDSRVTPYLGLNARDLNQNPEFRGRTFDLIVVDVSFISLEKILPGLVPLLPPGGHLLSLVKPQFEVGSANMDKRGVVKNSEALKDLEKQMLQIAKDLGFVDTEYFASTMKGRDGNQEFFLYGQKSIKVA